MPVSLLNLVVIFMVLNSGCDQESESIPTTQPVVATAPAKPVVPIDKMMLQTLRYENTTGDLVYLSTGKNARGFDVKHKALPGQTIHVHVRIPAGVDTVSIPVEDKHGKLIDTLSISRDTVSYIPEPDME